MQAGGHRFDPDRLHQFQDAWRLAAVGTTITPEMKTRISWPSFRAGAARHAGSARFFDIVNGFFNRCRDVNGLVFSQGNEDTHVANNLAEIIRPRLLQRSPYARLTLMVWILKREVRAFGGCLGMYRR